MRVRPRIRTVLLFVNLVILFLPLAGIRALRLYENELTRQTEAALVAQGAYVREHFRAALVEESRRQHVEDKAFWSSYGRPRSSAFAPAPEIALEPFETLLPKLDLAREEVRPRAEDGTAPTTPADPIAAAAGLRLGELLQRAQRYTLSGVRLVDHQGIVVGTSRGEMGLSIVAREEVRRALDGEPVRLLRERVSDEPAPPLAALSRGNRVRLFVALPVVHEERVAGAVVLSRTPVELEKALYRDRFVLYRYGGGLLALVVLVSTLTAVTISRPVEALIAQAQRARQGAHVEALARPGSHEIQQLSEAMAAMARTLRERASYIETFARNVSHEFKTPLATLRGTIELLRDHLDTMSAAERERFLSMLDAESARLQRLVDRLLVLAQADTAVPALAECDPRPVLEEVVGRFRARGPNVSLVLDDAAARPVAVSAETLDSVLSNLLDNARQHGGDGVRVEVAVRAAPGDGPARVQIEVADDGPGVSAANQSRVFEPFFTTAREHGGTGLGLSIVRALVEAHGGTVSLESGLDGRGLRVRLILPGRPPTK